MRHVPRDVAEIDAEWLTGGLAARHQGARVASVELLDRAEATNSHARLRVRYHEAAGAPTTLFCKLLPSERGRREAIASTNMGLREARFYEELASLVDLRVPRAHVVRFDERDGGFLLALEDLNASGCSVSSGPESPSPDAAARALEDLAALHVRFEDAALRRELAGWVPRPDPPSDYGTTRLQEGLDHHRDRLTDAFAEMAAVYIAQRDALHALWDEGPTTIIHGDAHIGNVFDDQGRTGFLDWGLIVASTPLRDVSYFISMTLSVEDRRAHERRLIEHYLDVRRALGGASIEPDEAWRAHRLHAAYLAPASCQIVTFPDDIGARRERFAMAFLERA